MGKSARLVAILAATALVIGVGVKLFQPQIGMALASRFAADRAGRDVTAALPDGLHVVICGSGSPLPDRSRAGPCTLVIAGKRLFVVDAGEGGARNMAAMGMPMGRIAALFLTHFHSDHIDGLGPLMLLRWTSGAATTPLPIHGPQGVEQVVAGFNAAYALDSRYRVVHHGPMIVPPAGGGGSARPFAIGTAPLVVFNDGGLKITAFPVNHRPVSPAVGYRFDYRGRSVVISGDTAPSPSLVAAATGADVLVHEALQPRMAKLLTDGLVAHGQANTAQITRDIIDYHSTPEQAADTAKAAGVRRLVLNHLVPPLPSAFPYPAFLGDAPDHFGGPITVGEDGMMFSLPAGSTAIIEKDLL